MSLDGVQLHLVDSVETASQFMSWLSTQDKIAVDTESTGLNTQKDVARLVQVGGAKSGWAIPWDRWGGVFEEVVKNFKGEFILHNAKFDTAMLQNVGLSLPRERIHDTRIIAHVLDSTYSTALKNLAVRHVDSRAAAGQKALDEAINSRGGWTWATVPIDFAPYWQYAALDSVLTYQLFETIYPKIESSLQAYDLELGVTWVIEKMERYGTHVDVPYAEQKRKEFDEYCISVEKWCKEKYNVSPGSNQAVIKILVDEGIDLTKRTATGALALDKDVLESIDHPLANAVFRRRQLQKLSSTYLKHYIEEHDLNDLIHPSINVLGARTGRMSMERPNLQNLPRRSEKNAAASAVRNCISARPGHTLLMCDFDQIEMRLLAHLANESAMIKAFHSENDFFIELASQIFNDPTITKSDPRRQITKNASYAKIYGAGVAKFAWTAGVSEAEAASFLKKFDMLYPRVRGLQREVQTVALKRRTQEGAAYVRSPLTQRKQIADDGKEYALVNYFVQGCASEIFKRKILELAAAGLEKFLILPVHDEIILDVPNEHVNDAVYTLHQIMNDNELLSVPITASVSHGERWGEKKEWLE